MNQTCRTLLEKRGQAHKWCSPLDPFTWPTYSSSLRIRDVALRTCKKRWTIGRSGERGSGISVLVARQDDHDDNCRGGFSRWNLKEIKLEVVAKVLNFRKAACHRWIACLHSLMNQGLSRLWVVGLCEMHALAIFIIFSENSRMVSVLFTMRCFWHWERNSSQ